MAYKHQINAPRTHKYMQESQMMRLQRLQVIIPRQRKQCRGKTDIKMNLDEITATIYSILQVLRMYNLQTQTQLRAVEQSSNIHLP